MLRFSAVFAGILALAAFSPSDPPPSAEAAPLPCPEAGPFPKAGKEFGIPFNIARELIISKRYEEALEPTRMAFSHANNQMEALAVVQLETAIYAGLGDQGWLLWSLREQLRLSDLCPGLLPEPTANAHRRTIRGLEDELSRKSPQ